MSSLEFERKRETIFGTNGELKVKAAFEKSECVVRRITKTGEEREYEGPRDRFPDGSRPRLVDLYVYDKTRQLYVEVKTTDGFSYLERQREFQQYVEISSMEDYFYLHENSPVPVWLIFVNDREEPRAAEKKKRNIPEGLKCPTGFFGHPLRGLKELIDHTYEIDKKTFCFFNVADFYRLTASVEESLSLSILDLPSREKGQRDEVIVESQETKKFPSNPYLTSFLNTDEGQRIKERLQQMFDDSVKRRLAEEK